MHDGEYHFDPAFLPNAHKYCLGLAVMAMENHHKHVVIDNTNSQRWEYQPYLNHAAANSYMIEIIDIFDGGLSDAELSQRNTHGVPECAITKMRGRWEHCVTA